TSAPRTSWATISLDVNPPSGNGSRLGISTALVASTTIWPDQDGPARASWTLAHGTASATIEHRAASSVVPAVIPAPSASTTDVNDSGPRLLAMTTGRSARCAVRANA